MKKALFSQFGASIDTLEAVIRLCPDEQWDREHNIWYTAFHTIFFLDYYLTPDPGNFAPPLPFDLSEFEDRMPAKVYKQDELLQYISYCHEKCRKFLERSAESLLNDRWVNASGTMNFSIFEICLYNMRHVQHHAAQINQDLRRSSNVAAKWIRASAHELDVQ